MRVDQKIRQQMLLSTLRTLGPTKASVLCRHLDIAQPTLSRLLGGLQDQVLAQGRGRATRYVAIRSLWDGLPVPLPVYEVRPPPHRPRHLVDLWPVHPRGYLVRATNESVGQFFDDLPWFLDGLRPAGFLGRLLAKRHPEAGLPDDIRLWSGDQSLMFAALWGFDFPGAFLVGDVAFHGFLSRALELADVIDEAEAPKRYPEIARDVLAFGAAGSSAAGEQPKFLATLRRNGALTPVLVNSGGW